MNIPVVISILFILVGLKEEHERNSIILETQQTQSLLQPTNDTQATELLGEECSC